MPSRSGCPWPSSTGCPPGYRCGRGPWPSRWRWRCAPWSWPGRCWEGRCWCWAGGAIGTLAAWLLAEAGARVTVSERNPLRAAWLEGLGFIAEVVPTPGGLYDRVIETVGAQGTLALAVNATRPGGSVVLVGLSDLEAPLPLQRAVLQEIRIQGSYVFTQAEFARATALLAHLPDALAVRRPFAMAQASFEELLAGRLAEAKVVLLHGGYDA
ncbi:zinc-binding dehydrogenase [Meiothermus taiwanensis]|uniref:zinc-binding dehydrogenase n=1 Tax=Meiothermus taiwanensis TaxID=172827 RepID=UPI003159E468